MEAMDGMGGPWSDMEAGAQTDFVECRIYSAKILLQPHDTEEQKREVQRLERTCNECIAQWTKDYIWQKDAFRLKAYQGDAVTDARADDGSKIPHLRGRIRFGDNVDDEWFIVWLLLQLSRNDPDLAISVVDNDGQFLLIEAALVIPRWIKPENTQNRVWIHKGNIHIIPLPRTPAELTQIPSNLENLPTTLKVVFDPKIKTLADQAVQQTIQDRVASYPSKAREFHYARCCLPWQIARILHERPQIIAPVVEAFYHRDLDGMFLCSRMEKFPPGPVIKQPATTLASDQPAMVMMMVRFTRFLYAMLACQRFEPPKIFAPLIPPEEHPDHQAFMLGMKIAAGFEILYDIKRKRQTDQAVATAVHDVKTYNFEHDREWKAFVQTLEGLGYFQGEIKGSREYQRKMGVAKQKYLEDKYESVSKTTPAKTDGKRKGKAKRRDADTTEDEIKQKELQQEIDEILARPFVSDAFLSELISSLRSDDDAAWMAITPAEVDDLLAQKQKEFEAFEAKELERKANKKQKDKTVNRKTETGSDQGDAQMLMDLIGGMKQFMGKISSYEGAEFPGQMEEANDQDDSHGVSFDADRFMRIMQQTLGGELPEGAMYEEAETDSDEEPDEFFGMGSDEEDDDDDNSESEGDPKVAEELRMRRLMREMDRELMRTNLAADFEKVPRLEEAVGGEQPSSTGNTTTERGEEDMRPVDVNLNLIKNILDSIEAEAGMAGPSSSLLKELRDMSISGNGK